MTSVAITTITIITGFLHIPPPRVGCMGWVEACGLSRSSTGGITKKVVMVVITVMHTKEEAN